MKQESGLKSISVVSHIEGRDSDMSIEERLNVDACYNPQNKVA